MQHGLLFESAHGDHPGVNVQQVVVRLPEALDVETLRGAWQLAHARHDALRTRFVWRGQVSPVQEVHANGALDFAVEDWRGGPGGDQESSLRAWLAADRARGAPLDELPTMRVRVLWLGDGDWVLVWTFHHALLDGRGFTLVLREVFDDYDALMRGERPARAAAPSLRAHVTALENQDRRAAAAYFRELLAGLEAPTRVALPAPDEAPAVGGPRHCEHEARLPEDAVRRLERVAQAADVTLFTCVQAAWAILLSRYARTHDVVFGVTRAGRHLVPEADGIAGCLINTVPQRAEVRAERPLAELLRAIRAASLAVRPFEHTALVDVQRESPLPRGEPLLTTNVVLERYLLDSHLRERGGAWSSRRVEVLEQSSFPLGLAGYLDGSLLLRLEHDTRTYAPAAAAAMLRHLLCVLTDMSEASIGPGPDAPSTTVGELRTMSDDERAELLRATAPPRPVQAPPVTYGELFRHSAKRHGDATALSLCDAAVGGDPEPCSLTYAQLLTRSTALAQQLRARGVRANDRVAICLPRSLALAEAVLAVLQAGAAYVPLDPTYPPDALAFMLEDSGARLLLTQRALAPRLPRDGVTQLVLDGDHEPSTEPLPERACTVDDLAYVIYTSGSTGRPKGVMVPHRALVAHNLALAALLELTPGDRVLQFASFSFDVSIEEMLPTWLSGATLVLRSAAMSESMSAFLKGVEAAEITVLNLPTAFWHELVRHMDARDVRLPASVRLVIVGGEKASRRAFATWQRVAPGVRWLNGYGPTEATITATVYEPLASEPLRAEQELPIGRPTGHARAYVLDERRRLVPHGVPGELFLAGACVARGYLGQDELTRTRFLHDPFWAAASAPEERMYATGDLVRWSAGLQLEFLGRSDRQLKLRGFRVEPGEIEAALERHPEVCEAVVALRPDASGQPQLWAWAKVRDTSVVSEQALREHVRARLPAFMSPARVTLLTDFPMTPGGKIDVAALPSPSRADAAEARVTLPRHATDAQLCALFAEALELPSVQPGDSFYDLGGHSLLAVRLLDRLYEVMGERLSLGVLRTADTPAELADLLLRTTRGAHFEFIYPIQPAGTLPPLFAVHVLGSNGSYFTPLAAALGPDQPVVGLTSAPRPGAVEVGVTEIAAAYAHEIMRYAPHGPVSLAAVSLGGVVAMEVARCLRAEGRQVLLVALFDALGPGPTDELRGAKRLLRHARELRAGGPRYLRAKVLDRARKSRERLRRLELRVRRGFRWALSDELRALDFIERNAHAALAHVPEPYEGSVTVFRATENVFYTDAYVRAGMGWADVARGGVEVIDVPGEHLTMLALPHVQTLAHELRAALRRAADPDAVQTPPSRWPAAPRSPTR